MNGCKKQPAKLSSDGSRLLILPMALDPGYNLCAFFTASRLTILSNANHATLILINGNS